ncbi:MAG: hypothetical protein V7761_09205, partial [Amylibacter sp.]
GKVFGRRKGEGVFSFVYKVVGPSNAPKVSVNPLSILTPGILREVFRKDIPDVGKAEVTKTEELQQTRAILAPEADR